MAKVPVTSGTGFLASWCIIYALGAGYRVRTTVRSLERAKDVRERLENGGVAPNEIDSIDFCAADLTDDKGWPEACKDCKFVFHVASPITHAGPEDPEAEVIGPATDGTVRVLKAAKQSGVQRVVVESSFAAIAYGHGHREEPFTEADWTSYDKPGVHVEEERFECKDKEGSRLVSKERQGDVEGHDRQSGEVWPLEVIPDT